MSTDSGKTLNRRKTDKGGGSKVIRRVFGGGWRQKSLCSITRIYTYLHAFTRIYTLFLTINVTRINEAEITKAPRHEGETDWPQKNTENAKDRKFCRQEAVGRRGRKWEKVGWSWEIKPAFPALARLIRRKWLISRVCAG